MITKKCQYCQSIFQSKSNRKTFCSHKCSSLYRLKRVSCICKYCNTQFTKSNTDYLRSSNLHFCSHSCSSKYHGFHKPKKEYFCKYCNISLGFGSSNIKSRKCCEQCNPNKINWDSILLSEFRLKFKNIHQFHARIRGLARELYRKANPNTVCQKCGYNKHIEVCHIKPIKDFLGSDSVGTVNRLENLIGLCPNCHWELDHPGQ